ncbi:MAG: spherulation-specific family 4 protein [Thaumarchaeota archaeon]|nr:spherulation-specific family 4 protein [Nitrososphaerota archaeon]
MEFREQTSRKFLATGYIALLVGAMILGFNAFPRTASAASTPVGIVIPLYTYPTDGSWAAVIQAKQAYPNVPFIAVINPSSGPGSSQDPNYVQGIKNLQAAGVKVLGYVATGYGSNSISSDESEVNSYQSWYGVNGIMFDEMSSTVGYETYYSTLNTYVHSLIPGSMTMGNPGTSVPTSFIGTLDALCIYESSGYPSLSYITYTGYSPSNFAVIVIGASLNTSFLTSVSGVVSWVYVTDANLPNPYDVLPSYFTTEVATLSAFDVVASTTSTTQSSTSTSSTTTTTVPVTTTTTTTAASGTSQLVVDAQDTTGAAISGYYVALYQGGKTISTGYSPATFTLNSGQTYTVESDGYGSCAFAYWLDTGSTNGQRSIEISTNTVLTAVLNCGTSIPATSTVAVNSFDLSGNTITGMWTTWNQNGAIITTGYTPASFTGATGGTYTVTVADYLSTVFCHWQDGATGSAATVSLGGNLVLNAYYSTTGSCPSTATTTTTSTSTTPSTSTTTSTTSTSTTSTSATSTTTSTTSTSTSTSSTFSIKVDSATTGGTLFSGMWTVVSQNGATITTGYTPLAFNAMSGGAYTISVANYGSYVFSHWSTGSTNSTITINPTQAMVLTAYYNVISCSPRHKNC